MINIFLYFVNLFLSYEKYDEDIFQIIWKIFLSKIETKTGEYKNNILDFKLSDNAKIKISFIIDEIYKEANISISFIK
jgi:hypothetical protein